MGVKLDGVLSLLFQDFGDAQCYKLLSDGLECQGGWGYIMLLMAFWVTWAIA